VAHNQPSNDSSAYGIDSVSLFELFQHQFPFQEYTQISAQNRSAFTVQC